MPLQRLPKIDSHRSAHRFSKNEKPNGDGKNEQKVE
jgi:hypothetical protein